MSRGRSHKGQSDGLTGPGVLTTNRRASKLAKGLPIDPRWVRDTQEPSDPQADAYVVPLVSAPDTMRPECRCTGSLRADRCRRGSLDDADPDTGAAVLPGTLAAGSRAGRIRRREREDVRLALVVVVEQRLAVAGDTSTASPSARPTPISPDSPGSNGRTPSSERPAPPRPRSSSPFGN